MDPLHSAGDTGRSTDRNRTRLVVASRRALLADALLAMTEQLSLGTVTRVIREPAALARLLQTDPIDALMLDVEMIDPVSQVLQERPRHAPRVLLVSHTPHAGVGLGCGEGCACGLASEHLATEQLAAMLRRVSACPQPRPGGTLCARCPLPDSLKPAPLPLSPREVSVFTRIGVGAHTAEIAAELGLSVKTVEGYRETIKLKLGLRNAAELREAALLWRRGERISAPTSCDGPDADQGPRPARRPRGQRGS